MSGPIYASIVTMIVTNLHSKASSATAGWQSVEVDNTSTLYADVEVQVVLDFANTAPANDKAAYVYVASAIETGKLSNPASGTEGGITLLDITANAQNLRLLGVMPYTTADEVVESSMMSIANVLGTMPAFWSLVIMNYSGAALASSGNTVKYRGVTSG
jgi:hypothetical protein